MNLELLLKQAMEAANAAAAEILDVYHDKDFNVELKGDQSPLTIADKRAHEKISKTLSTYPILSEEGKEVPYEERSKWDRFWLVDPLDGTKEFIKRNGEFTVNIALIESGKPILGVVQIPVANLTYFGGVGLPAKKTDGKTEFELPIRRKPNLAEVGLRVVASRSHLSEETETFISKLSSPVLVSKGSSLKFLMLADNLADVYPRFAPTMEWDTAAAHALVNQCGISVLKSNSESELTYNKENLLNPHFIAI